MQGEVHQGSPDGDIKEKDDNGRGSRVVRFERRVDGPPEDKRPAD